MNTPLLSRNEYRNLGPATGPEAVAMRLDRFLAANFPFKSRAEWKSTCEAGHLLVNGVAARSDRKLNLGEQLCVYHPIENEPVANSEVELLAQHDGLLFVSKPGNLPMHESGFYRRMTVAAQIHERYGIQWAPVHRLDRETSGIVVCGNTPTLRKKLSLMFESRVIKKTYLAVLSGSPKWNSTTIDRPLASAQRFDLPIAVVSDAGTPATTHFTVLKRSDHACLVQVQPETGRYNQIRAHAAYMKHHVIGDKTYHPNPDVIQNYKLLGSCSKVNELAGHTRHALHASTLKFKHPDLDLTIDMECKMPLDLEDLCMKLGL